MSSSAKRALKILAAVGHSGRAMGVTEIARALGVAPGTAFRGLDALQRANLLARHPALPRYVLGPSALGLRQSLLSLFPIRDVCLPYLRQLASASGETSSLHVRIGWYAARIATAPGAAEMTSGASSAAPCAYPPISPAARSLRISGRPRSAATSHGCHHAVLRPPWGWRASSPSFGPAASPEAAARRAAWPSRFANQIKPLRPLRSTAQDLVHHPRKPVRARNGRGLPAPLKRLCGPIRRCAINHSNTLIRM